MPPIWKANCATQATRDAQHAQIDVEKARIAAQRPHWKVWPQRSIEPDWNTNAKTFT